MELVIFAKSPGREPGISQGLREIGGEPMQCIDFPRTHLTDEIQEVREVGVVAERKGGIGLVPKTAGRIQCPTCQDRLPESSCVGDKRFETDSGRTEYDLSVRGQFP